MKHFLLAIPLPICAVSIAAPPPDFDTRAETLRKQVGAPGMAIAIVENGKVAFAKGYGVKKLGAADAIDADTIFPTGSTGKAFTVADLAILVDQGKIGWDDRVIGHLPGFEMYDPPLTGKTLAEVAKMRGRDPVETIMDLIAEDESRIDAIYFEMSEENLRKEIAKPWISFCSDEASRAPEGVFLKNNPHPRAYGSFARVLGKYVRDEKLISLGEAVRRLSALPATNLGLDHRGFIKEGMFADIVVFDPATIADRATFARPHQYVVGVRDVFVNGVQVLKDGEHTGAKPGRALSGPGKVN